MTTLNRQLVPIILGKRDGKTSDKTALAGTLSLLENYEMPAEGRYQKRCGSVRIGETPTASARDAFVRPNGEMVIRDTNRLWSVDGSSTPVGGSGDVIGGGIGDRGYVGGYVPKVHPALWAGGTLLAANTTRQGVAYNDGKIFVTHNVDGASLYSVIDEATGVFLARNISLGASISDAMPVAVGASVLMFYSVSPNDLRVRKVDAAKPSTFGAEFTVTTTKSGPWDAYALNGVVEIVWRDTASAATLKFARWDPLLMAILGGVYTVVCANNVGTQVTFLRHNAADGFLHVAAFESGQNVRHVRVRTDRSAFNDTLALASSAQHRNVTGYVLDNGTAEILVETSPTAPGVDLSINVSITKVVITAALSVSNAVLNLSMGLISMAWKANNEGHVLVGYSSGIIPTQRTYFVLNASTNLIECRLFATLGEGRTAAAGIIMPVAELTDGRVIVQAAKYSTGADLVAPDFRMPVTLDPSADVGPMVECADAVIIPGGITRMYDGAGVAGLGFQVYPEPPTFTTIGGSLPGGDKRIRIVYGWFDANGRLHRSNASDFIVATGTGIRVTYHNYRIPDRSIGQNVQSVFVEIYVTAAGSPVPTDAPYYLAARRTNVPTADTGTADVTTTDYVGNEELYLGRGDVVIENMCPPSSLAAAMFGERAWLIAADDRRTLWASKPIVEAEGAAFNDEVLLVRLEDGGGDLTAVESFDDKLIAFKRAGLHAVWGDGPANNGEGGSFAQQRLTQISTGTDIPIVRKTGLGIVYRADNDSGIYVLTPGLSESFLGLPVDDFKGLTLASINQGQNENRIRIGTTDGKTLVYDKLRDRWYVFTGQPTAGAGFYQNRYTYVTPTGVLRQEDPSVYTEDGVPINPAFEMTWIALAGIAGAKRVYAIHIIGEYLGPHRFYLRAFCDYGKRELPWKLDAKTLYDENEYGSIGPYGTGVYGGVDVDGRYHIEARPMVHDQRMTAIKLRGEEYFPDEVVGAGMAIEAFALEIGVIPGRTRLPAGLKMAPP